MSEGVSGGRVRTDVSNVLVIGSWAAGLRAAHEAGSEVVIVGKRPKKDAHTVLAAGGINAALGTVDPEDSWQQHFADTVREGYFLSDPRVVETTSVSSMLTGTDAPATRGTIRGGRCSTRSSTRWRSSISPFTETATYRGWHQTGGRDDGPARPRTRPERCPR